LRSQVKQAGPTSLGALGRLGLALLLGATFFAPSSAVAEEGESVMPAIKLKPIFWNRTRYEYNEFFQSSAAGADDEYSFFANTTRFGLGLSTDRIEITAVGQYTKLWDLPNQALGGPSGPQGVGGVYFAHNRSEGPDSIGVKYAHIKVKNVFDKPLQVQVGRFGFTSAKERNSGVKRLELVKNVRLAERLYGEFGFTHFTRSFDGFRFDYDVPEYGRITAYGFRPTQGGWERDINERINDIDVAGLTLTSEANFFSSPTEFQFYYNYYDDERAVTARADNSNLGTTRQDIQIHTLGGHAVGLVDVADAIQADWLVWGAFQTGDWFDTSHLAGSVAIEGGLQFSGLPMKPWIRVGYNYGSGDDDGTDNEHNTFYQLLPTARKYSLAVNYNLMNSHDIFAQLFLYPVEGLMLRFDVHHIQLAEENDALYVGAGPTQESGGIQGFVNRRVLNGPGGTFVGFDDQEVLTVIEAMANYKVNKYLSLGAYYAHSFGHGVIDELFPEDDNADYFFAQAVVKFD